MNLRRLWLKTNPITGESNWQHSVFVPVIGLYYLFVNRETLLAAGGRDFVWGRFVRFSRLGAGLILMAVGVAAVVAGRVEAGMVRTLIVTGGQGLVALGGLVLALDWSLALTLAGLGVFVYGYGPGHNDFVSDAGMIVTLFGIVLMLCGPAVMRTAWFPIVFLFCALPWPGLVYSYVAEPLSQLAAHVAVAVLRVTNVDAITSGTKIVIYSSKPNTPARVLNVAEACAGMRSLMTFVSLAATLAFVLGRSDRPLWQKVFMVVSAVPIAIGCNVIRISGQGLLDHYGGEKWSESFAHQMVGLVMMIPAFFLLLAVGWVLDQMFIEEADDDEATAKADDAAAVVVRKPAVVVKKAVAAPEPAVVRKAPAVVPAALPAAVAPATPPKQTIRIDLVPKTPPPPAPPVAGRPATPPRPRTFAVPAPPTPSQSGRRDVGPAPQSPLRSQSPVQQPSSRQSEKP